MTTTSLGLVRKKRSLDVIAENGKLDLGLVLTHACNLACTYCYTGEKKKVRMSAEVARRAIDLGFEAIGRSSKTEVETPELQLTFFGGEPLLEQELLLTLATEARARATSAGCRLLMQTTTNGTLLDADLARRLADVGVHLAISIDGTKEQQELGRPLAGGGSSYEATHAALRLLVASGRPFDVISVIDPCNVHDLANGVRELLDEGVDAIVLNMNWAGLAGEGWSPAKLAVFEEQMEQVAAIFIAWLRRGRYVRIRPLEGAIQALAHGGSGASATSKCHAGSRRLAVAPSGRIYGCPRSVGEDTGAGALGHIDHGLTIQGDPRGLESAHCACACAEETKNPMTPGPVLLHHDRVIERIAQRISAVLRNEYELVTVVEQSPPSIGASYPS